MIAAIRQAIALAERIPHSLVQLFARVVIAHVFWASARTKVDGFAIREDTYLLFAEEYRVPLLPSDLAAVLATIGEHVFPVLLVIGLATRFAALALIGMTLVIQFFVYPDAWWPVHSLWLAILVVILARGPGKLALDHWIARRIST
jgi:putative oxidoreductase